jgi:putative N6-adenine-specific DNA methylase
MPWQDLLKKNGSFVISATTSNTKIRHSQYAAQCLKDAIADQFRDTFGERPSVSKEDPDLWIDLHIDNNKALISIDTSGESLHKRGYRVASIEAPMQESLAAAILSLTQWDGSTPLIDPMCGSGTLLSEALILYCHIPASFNRTRFGFMSMPDYDPVVWEKVKNEEDKKIKKLPKGLIMGSDISSQAVKAARTNLTMIPHGANVDVQVKPYQEINGIQNATIVCNPPYGIRLQKKSDMGLFMEEFGNFLKRKCTGSSAYLYLGKKALLKNVGLKPAWKKPLMSGGLDGVLAKYDLY